MAIEGGGTEAEGQGRDDAVATRGGAYAAAPFAGTLVHVELGGVALSSPFRGEARRMGIVVHAGAPEQAWPFLGGSDGTVVATVDPYDLPPALGFMRELRRRGSSAGVLAVAATRGLRRTTSFPLRRAGVDEFVALSADVDEFAARLREVARLTRARRGTRVRPLLPLWAQPRDEDGEYRPMTVAEIAEALRERLELGEEDDPFSLTLLRLRWTGGGSWPLLRRWLRLEEGDLLADLPDGTVAIALEGVPPGAAGTVVERIARSQPGLGVDALTTLEVPPDQRALLALLGGWKEAAALPGIQRSIEGRST